MTRADEPRRGLNEGGRPTGSVLARNTALNLAGTGLPLVVAVAAMPPVVEGLGPARFGILALVWVVLGYVALLDLGLGRATTKFAAEALVHGDQRRIASSARIAAGMQLVVGLLAAAGLALSVPVLVAGLLDVPPELAPEARASFYLLAAVTPALLVTNTFRGLLEAAQRFDLVNSVRLPASTANFLLPLAGVLLGWSLPAIVAALMATRVAVLAAYVMLALRQFPALTRAGKPLEGETRALLRFGGWLTVSGLISPLLVYMDRFVIGGMISLAAVGYYSAPHELVMRLTLLPASVVATLFPALSAGARAADLDLVRRLVAGAVKFLLVAAGPVLITLAALAPDLLELWLGPAFAAESGLALRLLAAGMLANTLAYVPGVLLQAAGRPDLPARFHLLELPVHVVLLWTFVQAWGIPGAAAAWALRMALDAALLYGAAARLRLISWPVLRSCRVPGSLALLGVLAAAMALASALVPAMLPRLLVAALLVAMTGAVAWIALFDLSERRQLAHALRPRG